MLFSLGSRRHRLFCELKYLKSFHKETGVGLLFVALVGTVVDGSCADIYS